ncbi:MAG: hypothetical protein AAGE13_12480 [Pseudomonadota bacterium]
MNDTGWDADTQSADLVLFNARLVTPTAELMGGIVLRNGRIAALGPHLPDQGGAAGHTDDCQGDYLIPGIVDLHTDHVERHSLPRAHVRWDADQALAAHDGMGW